MSIARPGALPHLGGGLLALLLALLAAAAAAAAPSFPPLTGRVVDNAAILSPAAEARLTAELAELEAKTGRQVVVATVPDLQGYEIEDYGYQLGRAWGIGRKDQDDGVVFLVAPNQRKVRIEVGYGLEPVLTDALSNVILQQRVLPAFREGKLEDGVVAGAEAVIQQLALPEDQARSAVAKAAQPRQAQNGSPIPAVFILLIIFWLIGGIMRAFGGRRRSGLWWLLPLLLPGGGSDRYRGGGWSGGGGFSGGGGSFGGGGSSGSW